MTGGQGRLQAPEDAVRLLGELIGHRLGAVRYLMLFYGPGLPERPGDDIEQADYAVELTIDDRPFLLRWREENDAEALVVSEGLAQENEWSSRLVDVTDRRGWQSRTGNEIKGASISTQQPDVEFDEYVWAIRFDFQSGEPVVVALGELADDEPRYLPTSLLVFFDENRAWNYLIGGG